MVTVQSTSCYANPMKPFDPPTDLSDVVRADLCRPAEVQEQKSYLSKPTDDDVHDHEDVPSVQPPTLPPPPRPPGQQMLEMPRWYEGQHRQTLGAVMTIPYRNNTIYAATAAPE